MSEESVIYVALISGVGAIIIVIVKHWSASKCWTKNECCSCKLYREPSSPDSTSLDKNIATFKVDLNIKDDIKDVNSNDININNDNVVNTFDNIININDKQDKCVYQLYKCENDCIQDIHKTDTYLESISHV